MTKDGYILRLHRIIPRNQTTYAPILMHPGMPVGSSAFYASKKKSLAFLLVNNGCDVWISNPRGNRYSTKHKKLKIDDPRYWDFSFHEMAIYDLPAMIDYVLKVTRQKKLIFMSHSEGGSAITALLSTKTEYNDKISQNHLLTPSIYMENFPHTMAKGLINPIVGEFFKVQKTYDQLTNNNLVKTIYSQIISRLPLCANQFQLPLCTTFFEWFCGAKQPETGNNVDWKDFFLTFPKYAVTDTMGLKKVLHYSQLMESGKFRQFDHGKEGNMKNYGTPEPPDYELTLITTPSFIYGGDRDGFVSPADLERLKNEMQNVKKYKIVPTYSHCDIIVGSRAKKDVYKDILNAVKSERIK
jgi:pimeloyl-ACP methyl ester carboxylesterase